MQNAVNPLDVCCLGYTPLRGQDIGHLKDLHILCRGFTENLQINYDGARHKYGNKNVIET